MFNCEICGHKFKSLKGLQTHISHGHKISSKEYYDIYLKKDGEDICYCGKLTSYRNIRLGYHKYCSTKCQSNDPKIIEARVSKNRGKNHWTYDYGHPNKGKTYEEIHGQEKASELKRRLSELGKELVGEKNPFFGKHHTEEVKIKFRKVKLGKTYEELYGYEKGKILRNKLIKDNLLRSPWRDYWSEYPVCFYDKNYRLRILREQNYKCPICFRSIKSRNVKNLHHINYIKKDNRRRNLIYLCVSCHSSTNYSRRMWKVYLRQINRKIIEKKKLPRYCILEVDKEQSLEFREKIIQRRIH